MKVVHVHMKSSSDVIISDITQFKLIINSLAAVDQSFTPTLNIHGALNYLIAFIYKN